MNALKDIINKPRPEKVGNNTKKNQPLESTSTDAQKTRNTESTEWAENSESTGSTENPSKFFGLDANKVDNMLADLEKRFEESLVNDTEMNDKDFKKFMYLSMFGPGSRRNVLEIANKVDDIEDQLADIEADLTNHDSALRAVDVSLSRIDEKLISLEVQAYEMKYILKNIPLRGALLPGGRESNDSALNTVSQILETAGLRIGDTQDFFRLYPKKTPGKSLRSSSQAWDKKVPNIFIKFNSPRVVSQLFSNMSKVRETLKNAQLEQVCPPMLLPMWREVNAEGYKLRQRKMATRTEIRRSGVFLMAKNKGTPGDFVEMPLPPKI